MRKLRGDDDAFRCVNRGQLQVVHARRVVDENVIIKTVEPAVVNGFFKDELVANIGMGQIGGRYDDVQIGQIRGLDRFEKRLRGEAKRRGPVANPLSWAVLRFW